jgi:diaminopimelate epimerase
MHVVKGHAYGNDFLLAPAGGADVGAAALPALARRLCDRHQGIGADGLIVYALTDGGATMTLFNADGSASELSGNGLRCLAALVAKRRGLPVGTVVQVATGAGDKTLELTGIDSAGRYTFRANLGMPTGLRQAEIHAAGERVTASILDMGNPQCVVLGPLPDASRFERLGPALATHPMFPSGTNVEFAQVEAVDTVRMLIWERGVGPTASSGTGTSAAAVAAAAHGGANRTVDVIAPGGTQRVEWTSAGVYLTGWAELLLDGEWIAHA